jgi:hypothetical protein
MALSRNPAGPSLYDITGGAVLGSRVVARRPLAFDDRT